MGFEYNQFLPYQGSQENRYSEWTYGKDLIAIQDEGSKPLMLNAELDTAATQVLNTYAFRKAYDPTLGQPQIPLFGVQDDNGTSLYRTGQLNNDEINLSAINGAKLTAKNQPSLYSCPYYIILTDLVPTQFQKGAMKQNAIYYGLKSYSAGQYFYVYGSSYSQLVQTDRLVQSISTELRNPLTGALARCGKNSSIIYKIERDVSLPPITMTADGELINPTKEEEEKEEVAQELTPAELLFQALNITDATLQQQFLEGKTPEQVQEYLDDIGVGEEQNEPNIQERGDVGDEVKSQQNETPKRSRNRGQPTAPATPDNRQWRRDRGRRQPPQYESKEEGEQKETKE